MPRTILRTPDEQFADLLDFPYPPNYVEVDGARMHYVDVGQGDPILCLHGEPTWSFLYRRMIPQLAKQGRVIAPDFFGFGRSDKFAERADYSFDMHARALHGFLAALDLRKITIVVQDWGGLIGLRVVAEAPERFSRLVIMNTGLPTGDEPMTEGFARWRDFATRSEDLPVGYVMQRTIVGGDKIDPRVIAAYEAPFPDPTYKAGALQFPLLVPVSPDDPGSESMRQARAALAKWTKPALVMFSDGDPVTRGGDRFFRKLIPSATQQPEVIIRGAGHFLQEDAGPELATHIVRFIGETP